MSGFISSKVGSAFWSWLKPKLPSGAVSALKKAGDTFHEIDGEVPLPNRPTMPQAEVNKEFKEKETRVRNQHGNVSKGH